MKRVMLGIGTACALALMLAAVGAAQEGAGERAEKPGAAELPAVEAGGDVPMAELTLGDRRVSGRVISETDQMIRIERLGGGIIGYNKDTVREIRRFSVSPAAYYEELGDHYRQAAWDSGDAATSFAKAALAYGRALADARTKEEKDRIPVKVQAVANDRAEWHRDALRQEQLKQARYDTQMLELETQLTKAKLAALDRQQAELADLRVQVKNLQTEMGRLQFVVDNLDRDLDGLTERVDQFRFLDRTFVTTNIFLDLERSHQDLRREVDRLERVVQQQK